MADLQEAQRLATLFIRYYRKYRHAPNDELLEKLNTINKEYKAANGGGDLFSVMNAR